MRVRLPQQRQEKRDATARSYEGNKENKIRQMRFNRGWRSNEIHPQKENKSLGISHRQHYWYTKHNSKERQKR